MERKIDVIPFISDENGIRKGYEEMLDGILYDKLWLRFETDHRESVHIREKDLNGLVGLVKDFREEIKKYKEKRR